VVENLALTNRLFNHYELPNVTRAKTKALERIVFALPKSLLVDVLFRFQPIDEPLDLGLRVFRRGVFGELHLLHRFVVVSVSNGDAGESSISKQVVGYFLAMLR